MSGLLLLLLAYAGGVFLIAPLGSLAGTIVGFGVLLKRSAAWFFAATFVGAIASLLLLRLWFSWLDVPFHWWSYVVCMVSVMLYEGQRASGSDSPLHATGALFGIGASIYWGFISPPSIGQIT
jgi:hypothetical protein